MILLNEKGRSDAAILKLTIHGAYHMGRSINCATDIYVKYGGIGAESSAFIKRVN